MYISFYTVVGFGSWAFHGTLLYSMQVGTIPALSDKYQCFISVFYNQREINVPHFCADVRRASNDMGYILYFILLVSMCNISR